MMFFYGYAPSFDKTEKVKILRPGYISHTEMCYLQHYRK